MADINYSDNGQNTKMDADSQPSFFVKREISEVSFIKVYSKKRILLGE